MVVNTIRARLLVMLLAGLAVVLTAGGAAVYWIAKLSLLRQFDASLNARAHTLASLVKLEPGRLVFESGDAPAAALAETFFELRAEDGHVLKRSANLGQASLAQRPLGEGEHRIENLELVGDGGVDGGEIEVRAIWMAFRPRVDADDWPGGDVSRATPELLTIAAALDRSATDRALATLLTAILAAGAAVALTVVPLVVLGVRRGLAPLGRLSRELEAIGPADTISRRFDQVEAPGELLPVYRALNGMLDRLEQTVQRERTFADAAAHELRTPLAELRSSAEVALRWPDPQRAAAALREALAIGREMERLVESLLLLSRGNAGLVEPAGGVSEAPLRTIVDRCIDHVRATAEHKGLQIRVDLNGSPVLGSSSAAMQIIAGNLIDNAVRYTPAGGTLTIRSEGPGAGGGHNGSPALVVENGPVELAASDLPRLFEPFWRADRARSDREHVGLGLTVVQRIADSVGLRVEAALLADRLQMRVHARERQR